MPKIVVLGALLALLATFAAAQDNAAATAATAAAPLKTVEPGDYPVTCERRCYCTGVVSFARKFHQVVTAYTQTFLC
jgi:hypothetical protein